MGKDFGENDCLVIEKLFKHVNDNTNLTKKLLFQTVKDE